MWSSLLLLYLIPLAAGVSRAEFKSSVAVISEAASKFEGTQKLALSALLREIERSELDPNDQTTFENISDLLDGILAELVVATGVDQGRMDEVTTDVQSCNNYMATQDANVTGLVSTAKTNHENCRTTEEGLYDQQVVSCNSLHTFLSNLQGPDCAFPAVNKENIELWDTMLEAVKDYMISEEITYIIERDNCQSDMTAWTNKRDNECIPDQGNFESLYCQLRQIRNTRCPHIDTCYGNAVNDHNILKPTLTDAEDTRIKIAILIDHIQCLIEALIDGVSLTDRPDDLCPLKSAADSSYDNLRITDATYDDKVTCEHDTADITHNSNSQEFITQHYWWFPTTKAGFDLEPGLDCEISHPTS